MAELYHGVPWPADFQPAPARHVLSHVEYIYAGFWVRDRNGMKRFLDADRFSDLRRHDRRGRLHQLRPLPVGIIKFWLAPAGHFHPRVIFLAVILVVAANRA